MSELILKESYIEEKIVSDLKKIGYIHKQKPQFNEESNNLKEIVDYSTLETQLLKINKNIEKKYIYECIKKIKNSNHSFVSEANKAFLEYLKNGVKIKINDINDGKTINIKLVDYKNPSNNVFYFYNQFSYLTNNGEKKIPDIVIFLNGLPIIVIELKAPEAKEKLYDAYLQLKHYENTKKELMYWNVFCIVSNGFSTKYGTLFSQFNSHWWSWKKINKNTEIVNDIDIIENYDEALNNYQTTFNGLLDKNTLLNIIKNYCFWSNDNKDIKYIPTYYQYFAVEKTIDSIKTCRNNKGGTIWHTQGSGKSVTMVFLAHLINERLCDKNYKIIFVTDRNDLDDQLFKRFIDARDYLLTEALQISSRKDLINKLSNDKDFGIYLTTIQKFSEDSDLLSDKDNIIVIADEAHRSHNNLDITFDIDFSNKKIIEKEGYARYLRKSFPNAIFIGFTGTPLMRNKKTSDIFGDEIDKYSMEQSIKDNATVPIHYEKRWLPIILNNIKLNELDEISNEVINENDSDYINFVKKDHLKKKIAQFSNILNSPQVVQSIVSDFWNHYEHRKNVLNGKAMFVAFNRENAINIFKEMTKQNPDYKDKIKIIITGSNKDSEEYIKYIYTQEQKKEFASEFKKDSSKIKIVVVVDMWLTGFDVPDLDTMYILKIMRYHNLMQALARVNRTYQNKDKTKYHGLVVDYIGIWNYISEALKIYGGLSTEKKYDIEDSIIKLRTLIDSLVNDYLYDKELFNGWLNKTNSYKSIEMQLDHMYSLSNKSMDVYFNKIDKLKKLFNITKTKLNDKDVLSSQFFILVANLIKNDNVDENIDVEETLKKLKSKLKEIIDTGEIEVSRILIDGKKDLNYVMQLMQLEYKNIKKEQPINKINITNIENNLKEQIKIFSKTNPIKGNEISIELKKLVSKLEHDKNYEEYLTKLIEFARQMVKDNEKEKWVGDDEKLLVFYNVLSNDKFREVNSNSELLREIVFNLKEIISKKMTPEWTHNEKLKQEIKNDITSLLLNKYNYPPPKATEISKIIISETDNIIIRNKDAFNEETK